MFSYIRPALNKYNKILILDTNNLPFCGNVNFILPHLVTKSHEIAMFLDFIFVFLRSIDHNKVTHIRRIYHWFLAGTQ